MIFDKKVETFFSEMAAKPLMSDAIALTEKKMDMTLGVAND